MIEQNCPSCGTNAWKPLQVLRNTYTISRCRKCGLLRSEGTPPEGTGEDEFGALDLDTYFKSLESLRKHSAAQLLGYIEGQVQRGAVLDVGCSFGWFLDVAKERGWKTYGIEPSDVAVKHVNERADHQVKHGVFPATSFGEVRFEAGVMTDVLEHLSDPIQMLRDLALVLKPGGVIALRVPNAEGLIYKTADLLSRASRRFDSPMWRMWQLDFPYPHLWYFNRRTLAEVVQRAGYEVLEVRTEPVIRLGGVMSRVKYVSGNGKPSRFRTAGLAVGLAACALAAEGLRMHDECFVIARPIT